MTEHIIRNARIVTGEEEFLGTVCLQDGIIHSVDRGDSALPGAQDWGGDWLKGKLGFDSGGWLEPGKTLAAERQPR